MAADSFLRLLQFSDGLFPAGGYAHSLGLETLAQSGRVRNEADVAAFLRAYLEGSAAPTDAVAALCARKYAVAEDLDAVLRLDSLLDALKPAAELRDASRQMGRQTLRILRALSRSEEESRSRFLGGRSFRSDIQYAPLRGALAPEAGDFGSGTVSCTCSAAGAPLPDVVIPSERSESRDLSSLSGASNQDEFFGFSAAAVNIQSAPLRGALAPEEEIAAFIARYAAAVESAATPGHHPVVFGLASAAFDWPARETASAFLYAASAMIVGAALRLLPLGQLAGQRILAGAGSLIGALTASLLDKDESGMHSFTPELEIAAMRHEALDARLFRS